MTSTDATPFQTPPSLKAAAGLTNANEYAATWTGQSNSRPRGYPEDGLSVAQELALAATGVAVADIVIPDNPAREVGTVEQLTISTTLVFSEWNTNAFLRLGVMAHAVAGAPELGFARVLSNNVSLLIVKWISLPVNDSTVNGYLWRDPYPGFNGRPGGARYYAYEQVRVLTPYMPKNDLQPPYFTTGPTPAWAAPDDAEYPTANGPLRNGRRLILPAPWTLPAGVTSFEDLAVFLPLTRREGSHGYGISEIADASFAGSGDPTPHPIVSRSGEVFTFFNAVAADVDLTAGYLIVDWEQSGASKRSWARIDSNTTTTFTTDGTSWLGELIPDTPPVQVPSSFDTATDEVVLTSHGYVEGDRVFFDGTAAPAGITFGRPYTVKNVNGADRFQVAESLDHSPIDITTAGTGPFECTRVWWYTAWIGHYRDNPYMWLPGPEFGMPNEDQQPHAPFVHWRARGQIRFNHMTIEPPASFDPVTFPSAPLYNFYPFDGSSDARFGAMLPFAWRLAAALGKRVNMVCLGVNGAPLVPSHVQNFFAYPGRNGWWEFDRYGYGLSLEDTESLLAGRLKRLITVIAPLALLAESNTKPIKYLSSCHVQGESDALLDMGRELYGATITDYKRWLRDQFDSIDANPYENGALVPFAQPLLTRDPWETGDTGVVPDFQTFGFDTQGDTNDAIRRAHTADPFADYSVTEDIPKQIFDKTFQGIPATNVVDNAHFSGQGMVWQGSRLAKLILDLIEYAFSHTAIALASTNSRLLRIANQSLLYIGQGARQLTSLSDATAEASVVRAMMPEAIRQLLSMRPWSWASRLEPATSVKHDNPRWKAAYVVPGRAVMVLEVVPPQEETATQLLSAPVPTPIDVDFPPPVAEPEAFEIMRDQSGNRILFCNVEQIEGDVSISEVADGDLHPERLPTRPLIRYVDHALNPDDYSQSFATALSWLLASMIAPALIKGQQGEVVAQHALAKCGGFIRAEATHETKTQYPRVDHREEHRPEWIKGR